MRNLLCFLIALPLAAQEPATPPAAPAPAAPPAAEATPAPAAPQAAAATPAAENWLTGSAEVGYRFVPDVGGDFNTYRSVVNLGEGPKLLNADFTIQPTNRHWLERMDVHANSWGGDPYNTLRINARREGWYDFRFDYRNIAYFNFLPSFANPGTSNPALPFLNQYGFDTFRRVANVELDLFPGSRIIPYVAYSRNGGRGTGTTNFVAEANEYTVPTRYDDHSNEVRGGVRFEFNRWHATLEGGGINYRDDQEVFQATQTPNEGNVLTPFLGQDLYLTNANEQYGVRGGAAFVRGLFTASPFSWVDFSGQFLYSRPHTDIHFTRSGEGVFFDPVTFSFYNSELLDATGSARQPNPSGNVGFVLKPFGGRLRILESWMTNRMHTAGSLLLLEQLLVPGATISNQNLADATRFVANYNQQELNVLFDVTKFLTLRGGHRYVWGDTSAPPSFSIEGSGATSESGELRRNVGLAGLTFHTSSQFRLNFDFEASPGDRAYFRTSLNEYRKARIWARWQPRQTLQLTVRANVLSNENTDPAIRYDFLSRDTGASVYWNPGWFKGLGVLADYTRSTLRSEILYIIPSVLTQDTSFYKENAHIATLLADVPLPGGSHRPKLSLGGSLYHSQGTRPVHYYQPLARFAVPITTHVEFNMEWRWYGMSQPTYLYEAFRSHQYTMSLRFNR